MSVKGYSKMKNKSLSMGKNFLYNSLYEVFRILVPLLTTPYISRVLGADGIGTYTLAHTYVQYFILFAGLGFSTYGARELAYVRDDQKKFNQVFIEIFITRGILLAGAVLIYLGIFFIADWKNDLSYKICLIYLLASIFDITYYFKAMENFRTVAMRNISIKAIAMLLVFCFVKNANQVWLYTLILAVSELLGQGIMIVSIDKSIWKNPVYEKKNIKKHFLQSLSLFIPAVAIQVYTMLDKVMLGEICGENATGYYENAQKMVRLASTVASSIVAVSVPRMSYLFAQKDQEKFKKLFIKVCSYVNFLVFPMCFGLIAIASNFSSWYYGENFVGIDKLVVVGAPLIISLGWSCILGNMVLIAMNKQKLYTIAVYVGAAINIILNILLIPKVGALGATVSSVAAEFSGMILMFYYSRKLCPIWTCLIKSVQCLVASIVMAVVIGVVQGFLSYSIFSTLLLICIAVLVYILLMGIMKNEVLLQGVSILNKRVKGGGDHK